ncbi:MAG: DUF3987 domain-containing protein [Bacteroides sp.]|nr:DUF3987 domain-containing protein [Bacteroides sp.]
MLEMPTFPSEMYDDLPALFSDVVSRSCSAEDADMLLLGSITALSACLPQVYGIYGERIVNPNLFSLRHGTGLCRQGTVDALPPHRGACSS